MKPRPTERATSDLDMKLMKSFDTSQDAHRSRIASLTSVRARRPTRGVLDAAMRSHARSVCLACGASAVAAPRPRRGHAHAARFLT